MRSHLDAKVMAKTLRQELAARNVQFGHSECLEIVARQFGFKDWNTLAADLQRIPASGRVETDTEGLPRGWFRSGQGRDAYRTGIIRSADDTLLPSVTIYDAGREPDPGDFCTVMQVISADEFRGKRVAFKAELKCENVRGSVTIWMRVDDINGKNIAFDNREEAITNGSLKGSENWTERQVILDIPERGETIHFGFYLFGRGQAWARNLGFELTDQAASSAGITKPRGPQNLEFE